MVKFSRGDIVEIERKFVIEKEIDLSSLEYDDIVQGYVMLNPEVRVRSKGGKYYRTSKSKGDMVREEREKEISCTMYNILMDNREGGIVAKRRYYMPYGKYTIEIDVFERHLEGLVVAEVEFETEVEANSFVPPHWFGTEVTYDKRFKNKNLSMVKSAPKLKKQKR